MDRKLSLLSQWGMEMGWQYVNELVMQKYNSNCAKNKIRKLIQTVSASHYIDGEALIGIVKYSELYTIN